MAHKEAIELPASQNYSSRWALPDAAVHSVKHISISQAYQRVRQGRAAAMWKVAATWKVPAPPPAQQWEPPLRCCHRPLRPLQLHSQTQFEGTVVFSQVGS